MTVDSPKICPHCHGVIGGKGASHNGILFHVPCARVQEGYQMTGHDTEVVSRQNRIAEIDAKLAEDWTPEHGEISLEREAIALDLWSNFGINVAPNHKENTVNEFRISTAADLPRLADWLSNRRFNVFSAAQNGDIHLSWDRNPNTEYSRKAPRGTVIVTSKDTEAAALDLIKNHAE
jgi:hypothetical protein